MIIEPLPDKILHSVQIVVPRDEGERLGLQPHAVNHQGVVTTLLVADLLVPAIIIMIIIIISIISIIVIIIIIIMCVYRQSHCPV